MKLKIYTLWEDADGNKLKYREVLVCGNYIEFFQAPDQNLEGYEHTKRFFSYKKDEKFKKMFRNIKPNYFIKIHSSTATEEIGEYLSIAGLSGYAYINFFQKQYLDWNFGVHWFKNPKTFLNLAKIMKKIFK